LLLGRLGGVKGCRIINIGCESSVSQFRRGPPALTTYGVKVELVSRCLSVGENSLLTENSLLLDRESVRVKAQLSSRLLAHLHACHLQAVPPRLLCHRRLIAGRWAPWWAPPRLTVGRLGAVMGAVVGAHLSLARARNKRLHERRGGRSPLTCSCTPQAPSRARRSPLPAQEAARLEGTPV